MSEYHEIRLSGFGGQGIMLAGAILAEASGIYDNKNVTQTRSYGPESRGGASRSEIIISDELIGYPEATKPDLVLAMTQEAADKYHKDINTNGIMIIDSSTVKNIPKASVKIFKIPITEIAVDIVGKKITSNVVALGSIAAIVNWVSKESIKKVVLLRSPKGTEKINEKAFEAGFKSALSLYSDIKNNQ